MCERAFVAFWEEIAERPPVPDGALAPCVDGVASDDGLGHASMTRTPAPSSTA
jgi:hypothetical protein